MNEIIEKEKVENLIYEIRGKQVMLDSDLAALYQVETKRINEAVKRNQDKFPERFSFVLTSEEWGFLRSQFVTLENNNISTRGGRRYNYRVFTEEGVAMLATVLKSDIATKVSIAIMDAFVFMRKYISNDLIIQKQIINNSVKIEKNTNDIKLLQELFNGLEEKKKVNEIYFNGQIYDAYSKILDIFKSANESLIVIDSYADSTILDMVKRLKVKVSIITRKNKLLTERDIKAYNQQCNNLSVYYNNTFHDRYFIIDNSVVYHCGASINRIGHKTFSINLIQDDDVKRLLIEKINTIIKK